MPTSTSAACSAAAWTAAASRPLARRGALAGQGHRGSVSPTRVEQPVQQALAGERPG